MYKQYRNSLGHLVENAIIRTTDGACIPFAEANTDYQEYLKYIAEGGTVLPAEDNS